MGLLYYIGLRAEAWNRVAVAFVELLMTSPVPLWRLYLLRLCYLVMSVGLAVVWWPSVFVHSAEFAGRLAIQTSLLAGLGLVCVLGFRYPLKMVPVLLFEFAWKLIFLLGFALPAWRAGAMTAKMVADAWACGMVVIFLPLVPWGYVWAELGGGAGDRWR